jgi:hypothetical protein
LALLKVNPGFSSEQVISAGISLPQSKYTTTQQAARFHDTLLDRAAALPGVRSAALTDVLPLSGDDNRMGIKLPGREPRPGEHLRLNPRLVSAGYLSTMRIPLLAGREFTASDATGTRPVAILSDTAARRYWPDGNAVGKRFAFNNDSAPWMEIVGVVGAIHNQSLDKDPTPDVYLPYRENPYLFAPTAMTLVLRTVQDEATLAPGHPKHSFLDGSTASGIAHSSHGGIHGRFIRALTIQCGFARSLRRHCVVVGNSGTLWRDELPGEPAHQRDRHKDGAGCAADRCARAGGS